MYINIRFFISVLMAFLLSCSSELKNSYNQPWTESDREYLVNNLDSTLQLVIFEVEGLPDSLWNRKIDSAGWSIAMVVEHLISQDELFYRELRVLTDLPEFPAMPDSLFSDDESLLSYREITPQNTGSSPAYLEPIGRWCSREEAVFGYKRIRTEMIDWVRTTDVDLRKYYTTSGRGPTRLRDLHQLLVVSIAHTSRHHTQIKILKDLIQ